MVDLEPQLTDEFAEYMRSWSRRYLQRVRATIHTVAQLRSEIAELEAMMDGVKGVDYTRDKVSASATDDAMVNAIARMESLRAEYRDELERYLQVQADAHSALRNVRQPWRAVLTYRYVEGLSWASVTEQLAKPGEKKNYAEDYVRKELHDNGLLELYQFIPHDELPEAI